MKILYGVQGTGNGHISRARAMAKAFKALPGIEVDFLFSGRQAGQYFDMAVFGNYHIRRGMTFSSSDGRIDLLKTWRTNRPFELLQEIRDLDLTGYDLVISDFEPVTAWAAARQNVPSVAISHQAAFGHAVPKQGESLIDRAIMKYFSPTDIKIGLHWYHFNQPVLPPIVDLDPEKESTLSGDILVYLPFENLDKVVRMLSRFSRQFVCYHPDGVDCERGNVSVRAPSRNGFKETLYSCSGVIANGGFELPSEALSLGKKLLLKPLSGQFEQESNVATLEMLGLADSMHSLDVGRVRQWLDAPSTDRIKIPDVAGAIAGWVATGHWEDISQIWQSLWDQMVYPEHVTDLLSDFKRAEEGNKNLVFPSSRAGAGCRSL